MSSRFDDLRHCIYDSSSERQRFREFVVNTVMATDIEDDEQLRIRQERWDRAFRYDAPESAVESSEVATNRKATRVLELVIQAADAAHSLQHWRVYLKWNKRLFNEMYDAYSNGKVDKDPRIDWYVNEVSFYDNYVIPLATKLRDCGVFGLTSDEYLHNALENRQEWERRGLYVCQEIFSKATDESEAPLHLVEFGPPPHWSPVTLDS
jgi:hypothetical protein